MLDFRKAKFIIGLLSAILFSGLVNAGEGYKETETGVTVLLQGYGGAASEIYSSPALIMDVNRTYYNKGGSPTWVTLSSNNWQVSAFVNNLTIAMGLWENIPQTRLNFSYGTIRAINSRRKKDGYNMATLAGGTYSPGGQGGGHLVSVAGIPKITEFDITIKKSINSSNSTTTKAITVQEIGHGIGFNHSYLNKNSVLNVTGSTSVPSIMAYGGDKNNLVTAGALGPDDVALAGRIYPQHTAYFSSNNIPRLSKSNGKVQGSVYNASGTNQLYGANVLLIDRASGDAIVSRISGYATSRPNGTKDGFFDLDGVPPGNYDVLIAAKTDSLVQKAGVEMHYMKLKNNATSWPDAEVKFSSNFNRGWVRNITVSAGETVNLGYVLAGDDRNANNPSLMDVTVRYNGAGSYSKYWFYFWSANPSQMAHSSGSVTSKTYTAKLDSQNHAVKIYGWNGSTWVVVQNWVWKNFNAKKLTATWARPTKWISSFSINGFVYNRYAEAWNSKLVFKRDLTSAPYHYRRIDGTKLTEYVPPGVYKYKVYKQWTMSNGSVTHKNWTSFDTEALFLAPIFFTLNP